LWLNFAKRCEQKHPSLIGKIMGGTAEPASVTDLGSILGGDSEDVQGDLKRWTEFCKSIY
jgi:hypothetical protein